MNPVGNEDTVKTVELVKKYLGGKYEFTRNDMENLIQSQSANDTDPFNPSCGMPSKETDEITKRLNAFETSMPEHLRGKRPRDMNQEEKKEYNNYRTKLSRANKPKNVESKYGEGGKVNVTTAETQRKSF